MNTEAAKSEDRETFLRSDDEFHRSIAVASHNVFFVEAVTSILQLQRWAVNILTGGAPGSSWLAVEQHTRLFEAIRDGKPDQAAEAARVHVEIRLYRLSTRGQAPADGRRGFFVLNHAC